MLSLSGNAPVPDSAAAKEIITKGKADGSIWRMSDTERDALYHQAFPGPLPPKGVTLKIDESVPQPKQESAANASVRTGGSTSWIPPDSALLKMDASNRQRLGDEALEARRQAMRAAGQPNPASVEIEGNTVREARPTPPQAIDPTTLPALPDGEQWSPGKLQGMAEAAREFNLSADETHEWLSYFARAVTTEAPTAEAAETELRAVWGDRFDAGLRAAWLAFARLPVGIQAEIEDNALGNDPKVLKRLASLGSPLLEAERKIRAIMADKRHPWHAGDAKALEEMTTLYKTLKGTKPKARVP